LTSSSFLSDPPGPGFSTAIMQPYFMPYIGYFQLVASVDVFIVYDNLQYTKKGWINRNRFLRDGQDSLFSLPLKRASDFLDIRDRELAADFSSDKLLNQLATAYRRAPQFAQTFPLLERIVRCDERNLFLFVERSIRHVCEHLEIPTEFRRSSSIAIDHSLKGQAKVLAICEAVGTGTYVNAVGGTDLYSKADFLARGIDLRFIKSMPIEYAQFGAPFVPWLSIVDVLMFNPIAVVRDWVRTRYELT
jgi:WbqC-like protein family